MPFSLDLLPPGDEATVVSVHNAPAMHRRLNALGFVPGTGVKCLYRSAAGDPTAFWVRSTVIALRQEDSRHILVLPAEGKSDEAQE